MAERERSSTAGLNPRELTRRALLAVVPLVPEVAEIGRCDAALFGGVSCSADHSQFTEHEYAIEGVPTSAT